MLVSYSSSRLDMGTSCGEHPAPHQPAPCLAGRQGSPAAAKQEDSSSEELCTTSCVTGNRGQRLSGLKLPQPSAAFILSTLSTK